MSFTGRTYDAIAADLLTTLAGGIAAEPHDVAWVGAGRDAGPADIVLAGTNVTRVSRVSGFALEPGAAAPTAVDFGLADYELVPVSEGSGDRRAIRFLRTATRRPAPGTTLTVSYFPRTAEPTLLTDIQPGSVVRTLLETVAREVAVLYAQLDLAYESGFVDTATGSSLDRVVALLGVRRYRAGRPVGSVRFGRRAGTTGNVTIPAGTPVTDGQDKIRYETTETRTMLSGESTADVGVRGATDDTPVVKAGVLTVIQRSIAGLDSVTNPRATTTASDDEADVDLRARARGSLLAATHGTVAAIETGLLQLPEVSSVRLEEAPNGVPGELRVSVGLNGGEGTTIPDSVLQRLEELRPAGIRALVEPAGTLAAAARVRLVLAGGGVAGSELASVRAAAAKALATAARRLGVGEPLRAGRLVAAILADQRVADAAVALGERGAAPGATGADLDPGAGRKVGLAEADVTFEAETAERPAPSSGAVAARVTAVLRASAVGSTPAGGLQAVLTDRLGSYLSGLRAGAVLSAGGVLDALRDDASYRLDPLGLLLTVTAGDQFVRVAQGGETFPVGAARLSLDTLQVTS